MEEFQKVFEAWNEERRKVAWNEERLKEQSSTIDKDFSACDAPLKSLLRQLHMEEIRLSTYSKLPKNSDLSRCHKSPVDESYVQDSKNVPTEKGGKWERKRDDLSGDEEELERVKRIKLGRKEVKEEEATSSLAASAHTGVETDVHTST